MVLIKFLGTGGGRTVTMTQVRATGGIYLQLDDIHLYIDPGPGALIHSIREKIPLYKLDALFLSHAHLDHVNDANAIIEAMTRGAMKKRGILVGSVSALEGYEKDDTVIDKVVSTYHENVVEDVVVMSPGEEFEIGNVKIRATKTIHTDPTCIGWRFESKSGTIGYTSDTIYFENIGKQFCDCDVLILNCLFNRNPFKGQHVEFSRHMDSEDAIEIIRASQPKLAIIQHYGMEMLRSNPWEVARIITEKTGIKTMAVRDFQEIRLDQDKYKLKGLDEWTSK